MHVVYLHPHFTYPGGAGAVVLETAKRLVKLGVKVSIITQTASSEILKNNQEIQFELIGGPLPNTFLYWMKYFLIYKRVETILNKINPDIIFPHVFPANYWGFLYKKNNPKIPCIWYCHEPSAFVHDKRVIIGLPATMRFLAIVSNPIIKIIDKKLVHYADSILVNSDFSASRCKKIYHISKTEIIYPGIEITEYPQEPEKKENYILCVSQLSKFKQIDLVIQSVFLMKQQGIFLKLIIIGDGEEKKKLISQSRELGLTENVFFLGKVDRKFLISNYSRALCVVFPSIDEPFGIVPIEAQAAWTPVIATKSGGPMESIIDGESGFLIKPGSLDELIDRLIYFLENPSKAESMGISARKNVSTKFTWDKASKQLMQVFTRYAH